MGMIRMEYSALLAASDALEQLSGSVRAGVSDGEVVTACRATQQLFADSPLGSVVGGAPETLVAVQSSLATATGALGEGLERVVTQSSATDASAADALRQWTGHKAGRS